MSTVIGRCYICKEPVDSQKRWASDWTDDSCQYWHLKCRVAQLSVASTSNLKKILSEFK